jgi:hypothetical protein
LGEKELSAPKVFVSYSHDSPEHKQWVLDFATQLVHHGVDVGLDQWELGPGDDLPHFMETHLAVAERVLMICTGPYVEKANTGRGGVGYEKMIITAELMKKIDSNKIIPIIRQNGTHDVPTFLGSKYFIDFSRNEQFEFNFDELKRTLHKAPLFEKPAIGNNPYAIVTPPVAKGDGLLEVMTQVVRQFNKTSSGWISYSELIKNSDMSRIRFDLLIGEAVKQDLVEIRVTGTFLDLTTKGKRYAIEHEISD